jgi:uncharacterized protein (TIGR03435 family)
MLSAKLAVAVVAAASAFNAVPVRAQESAPAFEGASVRENKSGGAGTNFDIKGDRFTAINATLRELIRVAYQIRDLQIAEAPDWIDSARFDIIAKAFEPLKMGVFPPHLRLLLADRFGLKVHNESRETSIYALVVARRDGTLGPSLRPVDVDRCPEAMAQAAARARSGQPAFAPVPGQRMTCGLGYSVGVLTGGSISLAPLAQRLSPIVGRVVIDRTDLTGKFDFELKWAQDPTADAAGPSIFTALQEQLGLKLESARGPVEVLVIDHVERPTPD